MDTAPEFVDCTEPVVSTGDVLGEGMDTEPVSDEVVRGIELVPGTTVNTKLVV